MPSIKSVCWCFTLNFTGEMPELSFDNKGVEYAIWQHEKVSHDHLQGFFQFKGRRSLLQAKKVFDGYHPHLEVMRAPSAEIARDYCSKDESRVSGPWVFGTFVPMGSNKRKLTELLDNSDNEIEEPQKYRRAMAMKMTKASHQWALENPFPFELKEWQERLSVDLNSILDDRAIFWVYGPTGGEGKSQFAKYLGLNKNWLYLPGGKVNDMMYMYCKKPQCNLVIDYPRCNKDFINYAFLEMVKNRTVYSYKYEPVGFIDPTCNVHVVVMANFLPDYERISQDRIKLIDLS
ncbi:replication protein [Mesta yellow vein mosaic alphasatellite]|uniref:Replication protein n=1 Tax=Mesta yellow vein mosaic alphasatellite TaxID=1705093 RepID=J7K777_9VIRU|nr:replication protein [Mesta yellow vein mosaic alphasatellite]AFQ90124.1 replication protein [Mesta yellow vein mosaic alphasatellite]